jgi:hypothetical protein
VSRVTSHGFGVGIAASVPDVVVERARERPVTHAESVAARSTTGPIVPRTHTRDFAKQLRALKVSLTGMAVPAQPQATPLVDPDLDLAIPQEGEASTSTSTATATASAPASASGAPVDARRAPDAPADAPLTPLEQAVHELLSGTATDTGDDASDPDASRASDDPTPERASVDALTAAASQNAPQTQPTSQPAPVAGAPALIHAAPVAHVQLAEQLAASASHVHLVVDDGGQRVVMTVAMRGNEVNVALRTSDDHTAAALARNAGALDDAMRARGLSLGQLDAEHDRSQHREPERQSNTYGRDREPEPQHDEPFELEEFV